MEYSFKKKNRYFESYPKPSINYLKNFYEKIYLNKKTTATYSKKYSKEEIKNKKNRSALYIKIVKSLIKKKNIKFLEIGYGEGFLLKAAYSENFNVLGVDYQNKHVKKFNKDVFKFSKKIDPDYFLSSNKKKMYDVIALINVVEHVRDPIKFVNNVKSFLNKKGIIILSVPNDFKNFQNLLLKINYIKKRYWFAPPQHLTYFNNVNILNFFKKLKLSVKEAISDFPIEFFLYLGKKNYTNNKNFGKQAHQARLIIDNFILSQKYQISLDFYKAVHNSGVGRNMIFFLKNEA